MRDILDHPERITDLMCDIADAEILPRFKSLAVHEITEKRPGDLVTVADHASEEAFRRTLPDFLPGSVVLGEEGYEADAASIRVIADDAPVWIVDPVDGTHNFAHGKGPFTVIVALVHKGETRAGWIVDPVAGDAVVAIRGAGAAHWTPQAGAVPIAAKARTLASSTMTAGPKLQQRLRRAAKESGIGLPKLVARYRCVGREYMDIALGTLDLARYAGRLKPWDHAAGCLIVDETGGRASRIDDERPYRAEPAISGEAIGIAGDARVWADFRALVRRADALK